MGGMSEWQPIETAPKDGTAILLFGGDPPAMWELPEPRGYSIAHWSKGRWIEATGELYSAHESPTHWMPLPAAPVA